MLSNSDPVEAPPAKKKGFSVHPATAAFLIAAMCTYIAILATGDPQRMGEVIGESIGSMIVPLIIAWAVGRAGHNRAANVLLGLLFSVVLLGNYGSQKRHSSAAGRTIVQEMNAIPERVAAAGSLEEKDQAIRDSVSSVAKQAQLASENLKGDDAILMHFLAEWGETTLKKTARMDELFGLMAESVSTPDWLDQPAKYDTALGYCDELEKLFRDDLVAIEDPAAFFTPILRSKGVSDSAIRDFVKGFRSRTKELAITKAGLDRNGCEIAQAARELLVFLRDSSDKWEPSDGSFLFDDEHILDQYNEANDRLVDLCTKRDAMVELHLKNVSRQR